MTGAALGVTAYSEALGSKLHQAGEINGDGLPTLNRYRVKWEAPADSSGLPVGHSPQPVEGEQQRPSQVLPGVLAKPAQLLGMATAANRMMS